VKNHRALLLGGLVVVLAACQPSASPTDSQPSIVVPSVAESMAPGESAAAGLALTVVETTAGPALAGEGGLTLYIHTEEGTGEIVCVDDCLANWPALEPPVDASAADASLLGEVTRPDGLVQVTYNGFPLYYFAGDSAEGDATGEGLNGVWFIADPAGN
jgi:predicted lipoprotein with Yx(FWY)xxD motif